MATPYVGNQDYRGYLNYLGSQGNTLAKQLIGSNGSYGYVNNEGQYSGNAGIGIDAVLRNTNNSLFQQYNSIKNASTKQPSIYGNTGGGGGAPQVYAPKLDISAVNAQARASAENAVNPYYTKVLNDFLAGQAAARQQRQTQYETNVKNLEDTLKQTLEQNDITKQRTTEDVAQNEAQIANQADISQTDTGEALNQNRLAAARASSTGGLGQQKVAGVQRASNVQEQRQTQEFQQQKQQQDLFQNRTFADLTRSGELAGLTKEKGTKLEKFDLDSYIQNQGFKEQDTRNQLETSKQQDISSKAQGFARDAYNNYIQGISNPAQRIAAAQQYGGSF